MEDRSELYRILVDGLDDDRDTTLRLIADNHARQLADLQARDTTPERLAPQDPIREQPSDE